MNKVGDNMKNTLNTIDIRPTTSVYATYRRLSYKPWYAIAEFVDNSTQSYFANKEVLHRNMSGLNRESKLTIEINYNNTENTLTIYDNAYGMEIEEFKRALILDSPPSDRSGRSEFGMGLKTAACWFGSQWTVETTQLGSDRILIASVDVNDLAESKAESIVYSERITDKNTHFTRITIRQVQQPIRGRTVNRVQDHLSSIYRQDIRNGDVNILWNGVPLTFDDPEIYSEVDSEGNEIIWKENLEFDVPWDSKNSLLKVKGWVAIRKQGKQRDAGFVLMRRGRVILGGPEEGFKPNEIFGQGNSFKSQRLFGEFHLDDWPVTQAKDGFDWADGLEDNLIDTLKVLTQKYAEKAESIRANQTVNPKPISKPEMESISIKTKEVFQNENFGNWIKEELEQRKTEALDDNQLKNLDKQKEVDKNTRETENLEIKEKSTGPLIYTLNIDRIEWKFKLYWQNSLNETYWMSVGYPSEEEIDIYLNLLHPFFSTYINDTGILELLQKLVISLALAEKMARLSTSDKNYGIDPADLRTFMNKILTKIAQIKEV